MVKFCPRIRILLLITVILSSSATTLNNNLVAYYAFNGNANDLSGNGNHGTVHSANLAPDKLGNVNHAYNFNGVNSYIEISNGNAFNFVDQLTLSLWVKPRAAQVHNAAFLSKSHGYSGTGWTMEQHDGYLTVYCFTHAYSPGAYYHNGDVIFAADVWSHFVVTKQGTVVKVYANNVLTATGTPPSAAIASNGNLPLTIGAWNSAATTPASGIARFFNGLIDEIRIYNRALSVAEVSELYFMVPTDQPTSHPSGQPTRQPSKQPNARPTSQPSIQPTGSPSSQPTHQPSSQPSSQPNGYPTSQPTRQPSSQPSSQPNGYPTSQPTRQPSLQPSNQPNGYPTSQPTRQPSQQPSSQPNGYPTSQPTRQPSRQPSIRPSSQPTFRPTSQPSIQPTVYPTSQPSLQPSGQPSGRPTTQPTIQPSRKPSSQPSSQPTRQPSAQPSQQPNAKPTSLPSAQPTTQPSALPTFQPSKQPSTQPTYQPSTQPTAEPSAQPSIAPSAQPTTHPSLQLSVQPTAQPSVQPSTQPTTEPSGQPSVSPSIQPSSKPSSQPSTIPSSIPSASPTVYPSNQPSSQPTLQPSCTPSVKPSDTPSSQPSLEPSIQPSNQPSQQPTTIPTSEPSSEPSLQRGVWATLITDMHGILQLSLIPTLVQNNLWVCGISADTSCTVLDAYVGLSVHEYSFPWTETEDVVEGMGRVLLRGRTLSATGLPRSDIANCLLHTMQQLQCNARTLYDTDITALTHAAFPNKVIYTGTYSSQVLIYFIGNLGSEVGPVDGDGFIYDFNTMQSVTITHIQSPPAYIGGFFVGTSISSNGLNNYIVAGVVRADSGSMNAMYLSPTQGIILNREELVNAMALEYENPDTFITGGLELSDGAGMHAYLLRMNAFFGSVKYALRYQVRERRGDESVGSSGSRRVMGDSSLYTSVSKAVLRVGSYVYIIIDRIGLNCGEYSCLTVLRTDMNTGLIQLQVHVTAPNSSLSCSDITASADQLYLYVACSVQYLGSRSESFVVATDMQLLFTRLPVGFTRHSEAILTEVYIQFKRIALPVSQQKSSINMQDYVFSPTLREPTDQRTVKPSSQPNSSPTPAPSVSPQPSSQPSTSGPTNTYKPTGKLTPRSSKTPTLVPSGQSIIIPTARPITKPSPIPSIDNTFVPIKSPSRPSRQPYAKPTVAPTTLFTVVVGAAVVKSKGSTTDDVVMIFVYVVAILVGMWCVYHLVRCCVYVHHRAEKQRALRAELDLIQVKTISQFCHTDYPLTPVDPPRGAYIDGPVVNVISNVVGVGDSPAKSVGSSSSSSIVLSSLHSSEMSDASYNVHLYKSSTNEEYSCEQCLKPEISMEQGSGGHSDSESDDISSITSGNSGDST